MAIKLGTNFELLAQEFLDSRQCFDKLADMKAFAETSLPDGFLTYNKEDKKIYQFDSTNTVDATTGKWRAFASGGNNTIATNTILGNVIIKKDGGISVDSKGYIWIDGYSKTTSTNPTTGEVTTVTTNGGITTTEVSNPTTGETTTTTSIGEINIETKNDGKGNVSETTSLGGAELKQETDPSGNKSTSIGNKVVSGTKTETTTTTSTNPSTGNPVTTTITTTTTPNGTQQTTTSTETDPASGDITTTVETINGGSDGVDVGSASGDRTTTVTDSTGTTISTSTEDVSYTNGQEDQWLTQSEANTMIDNIGNSLGWEF